jgi:hypothetical protein
MRCRHFSNRKLEWPSISRRLSSGRGMVSRFGVTMGLHAQHITTGATNEKRDALMDARNLNIGLASCSPAGLIYLVEVYLHE